MSLALAVLLAFPCVQDEPTFQDDTWTHPKENVKFGAPKGKGYVVIHDRERLKDLGEKMLCVGTNESQDVILFLCKESSEESLDEKKWIEKWEASWKEQMATQNPDVKQPYVKNGGFKLKSGLPGGDYTIYLDGKERKSLVAYLCRGKDLYVLMVIGRSRGEDRDDCYSIVDSFKAASGSSGGADVELADEGRTFRSPAYGLTFSVPKNTVTLSVDPEQLKSREDENQKVLCMGAGSNDEILLCLTHFKKVEKGTSLKDYRESVEKSMDANYNSQKGGGYKKQGGTSIDKVTDRGDYDIQNRAEDYRAVGIYRIEGDRYFLLMVMVKKSKWLTHRDTAEAIVKSLAPLRR
ncbi:MAG: hypothetical protein HYY17_09910 [Planctomycetes bacterium]|nr:hypothetical protein [Planctomycetota bacterium]